MPVSPGSRLDAYELVAPLGRGGMGEVWLATETKLGRKVALKLLPADLTLDGGRVARFEQEARAASALSHPNVCTILALGETADGQRYIAMEYVEGETLRQRLQNGRLSIRESLDIATQIASALAAAHASGIVHRDIKPENVMLRPDGFVKVLDFGLAKLVTTNVETDSESTRTAFRTEVGHVVGTMTYMSPEQARVQEVDGRTDIWSMGVVLYEMLAGQSPFAATSSSDALAAILQNEPAPLARFNPDTPAEAQRIVTKTLRKERSQRYQTVQDLLLDLQALRQTLSSEVDRSRGIPSVNGDGGRISAARVVPPFVRKRVLWLTAAATLVIVGAVLGAWWRLTRSGVQNTSTRSTVRPLSRITFGSGLQTDATWSPDGRSVAYSSDAAGNFDIWVQPLAGGSPTQVTRSSAQDTDPSWSPDGRSLVFRSERDGGGLFLVPALGGPERQLTSFGRHPEWSADGSEVLFRSGGAGAGIGNYVSLYVVAADGGAAPQEVLRDFLEGGNWYWIASHPDGRISALGQHRTSGTGFFTVSRDGRQITRSLLAPGLPLPIAEGPMTSGRGTRIVRFAWNATGTALYVEAVVNEVRNIWRVQVDPTTLRWQAADQLTGGTGADVAAAVSRDGRRIVFTTQRSASRLWVFPFDAFAGRVTGEGTVLTPEDDPVENSDLSPDGSKAIYLVRPAGGKSVDLWSVDTESGQREQVGRNVLRVCWSPDGTALGYTLFRPESGEWVVAVRPLAGPERLLGRWSRDSADLVTDWTRDGSAILGSYLSPTSAPAVLALWPSSGQRSKPERVLFADPSASLWQGRFSPNSRWITFLVQRHGTEQLELIVAPSSGAPPSRWTRLASDHQLPDKPRWAPDTRALYFISRHGEPYYNLWGIHVDPERGVGVGAPFKITKFDSPRHMISPEIGDTETGISAERALLTMVSVTGSVWMLDNVEK